MNMSSTDSGVETGNDSNDSSIVQHESQFVTNAQQVGDCVETVNNNNDDQANLVTTHRLQENFRPSENVKPEIASLRCFKKLSMDRRTLSQSSFLNRVYKENDRITHPGKVTCHLHSNMENPPECFICKRFAFRERLRLHRNVKYEDIRYSERRMRQAASTNNFKLVAKLLTYGISPNNHDNEGRTPLHHAACRGLPAMVDLLLMHGADPDKRDCLGNTPLHLAVIGNNVLVVTLLLKSGTNVLLSDKNGHNPIHLAQAKVKILQKYHNKAFNNMKKEVYNVVDMLIAYLQNNNMEEEVETLSNFCSRLSLSNTSDQLQDNVKDLLANIEHLSLTN